MKTEKIAIGCNIHGVDVNNISDAEISTLQNELYKNRIIILKNQNISDEAYCNFATRFGTPIPYLQENYHHPKFPLIFVSSNVKKDGKQIGVPRTGGYWHSDTSFEKDPKVLTMLLPKVLPSTVKRTTKFIDMNAVYKSLPKNLLNEIEGEEFIHSGRWKYKIRPEDAGIDISEMLEMIDFYAPPVNHPAILEHPYTKEKIVYATRGFTVGIKNKSLDDSQRILNEIFDFAETDQFIREVTWSLGDLIIWDNRFLAHCSGRKKAITENIHEDVKKEEETMMYRITLKDAFPLCASQLHEDVTTLQN
ncbi:TauD/TfdA dioxygenase family protein [Sporocytophaga myxococcoides]|uniref:TauD/TfdA dioxygenase family protein n=1 Tax=Sporocytophaga myxococcoides TaxID=153721 RepID=UPI00042981F0|nr:TauD/TfdA family dioxygenase [Sporocytophaga myxococcoides]